MMSPGVILFDPVIPPWLIVLSVALFAWASWRTYGRCSLSTPQRWGLWGMRLGAVCLVAWLLLQARRRQVETRREEPLLAVALDVSASMTENPGEALRSRSDRALEFLRDGRLRRLERRYRVVEYHLGADLEEVLEASPSIRFNAPRSHIGSGLNRLVARLRADNLAAVLLLSDGLDQSGEGLAPHSAQVPILIPELEDPFAAVPETGPDWWLADLSHPRLMAVGWRGGIDVLVRRNRSGQAATCPIHLRQDGRILRTSMVQFAEGESFQQITFSIEPVAVGQLLYEVTILPDNDTNSDNNRREFLIDVSDPKNRVLYLEGVPRWEFKFLKRALLAEKTYQLSAFVRGPGGSFVNFDELSGASGGSGPAFTPEELAQYKVVVLGDLPGDGLAEAQCQAIRDFVDKGGGLLLLGAAAAYGSGGLLETTCLRELAPAESAPGAGMKEGRFAVDLTPMGRTHPALGDLPLEAQLPPVLSFWAAVRPGEFSTPLIAAADGSPILVCRRYGQGRVAMVLSDSLWRWQLGDAGGGSEKSLYNRFVTQLVHWLAPSEKDVESGSLLQVVVAENEVELREKVTIGALYDRGEQGSDPGLNCRIRTPGEGRVLAFQMLPSTLGEEVGLSRPREGYRCFFTPQETGRYDIDVSTGDGSRSVSVSLLVTQPELERTGAPLGREYLGELARASGGVKVPWKERYELLERIPYAPREVSTVREWQVWDRWWWLAVLVLLFCAEWWWRRRLDLV